MGTAPATVAPGIGFDPRTPTLRWQGSMLSHLWLWCCLPLGWGQGTDAAHAG